LFTPPSLVVAGGTQDTIMRPSVGGGANWSGAAVDPETGMLYVPSRNLMSVLRLEAPDPSRKSNLRHMEARGGAIPRMPEGLPFFKPPYPRMTAIDMNKGEHVWMMPLGDGRAVRNHPRSKDLNLPAVGGDSGLSGPLLISAVSTGGKNEDGPRLVARDKATRRELASVDLPSGAIGKPMTHMIDGKQYIAMTVGGDPVPELVAFTLL
jgi:quinoprotein glucose dehydrogenase